jgi:hypothetical protein
MSLYFSPMGFQDPELLDVNLLFSLEGNLME